MAGAKRRGILLRYFEEFRARQATAIGRGATGAESWVTLLARGRPRAEPAVRDGAARERGRRRSAYEAPHGSVAPGPVSNGAESKRRRCPAPVHGSLGSRS